MTQSLGHRLEQYTLKRSQEVLLVKVDIDGEADQIVIFKGFSSSLMRPTAFDPDVPVLPEAAKILSMDRLQGPYIPDDPHYIERNLPPDAVEALLTAAGL